MADVNFWIGGAPAVATQDAVQFPLNVQAGTIITVGVGGQFIRYSCPSASDHDAAAAIAAMWNASTGSQISKSLAIVTDTGVVFTSRTPGVAYGPIVGTMSGERIAETDEIQAILVPAAKFWGTYQIVFSGSTSAGIPFNASAADVQAALEAIPTIGTGSVAVAEPTTGKYVASFQGSLGGKNLPMMVVSSHLRGISPVVVTVTAEGGYGIDQVVIVTVPPTVDGGTVEFGFQGATSAAVPWNSSAVGLQSALEAMSTIGTGNVAVTDGVTSGQFKITFQGDLGHCIVPTLYADTDLDDVPDIEILRTATGQIGLTEVDLLTVFGTGVGGGTYQLQFNGETTAALNQNSTAADVKAALVALGSIGADDLDVTSPAAKQYRITFSESGAWGSRAMTPITPLARWVVEDSMLASQTVLGIEGENEVQYIALSGYNAGTYTLSIGGETTTGIAWNAATGSIKTALGALTTIGSATNVDVTSPTSGQYYVTFQNARSSRPMDKMEINPGGLDWQVPASVTDYATGQPGDSPVFTVSVTHATGGTWKLSTSYGETAPMDWNNTPDQIAAAINAALAVTLGGSYASNDGGTITIAVQMELVFTAMNIDLVDEPGYTASVSVNQTANGQWPINETRAISIGTCDGGTFTLSFNGYTTTPLSYAASNASIQSAMEALASIGTSNMAVSTAPTGDRHLAFVETLGLQDITYPIIFNNHLTYSLAGSRATVTRIKDGVRGFDSKQWIRYQTIPVSGTFTLAYSGVTSASLSYSATDSEVQVALEGIASIGAGNVGVTGSWSSGWYATFTEAMASKVVGTLAVNDSAIIVSQPAPLITRETEGQTGANETQIARLPDNITSGTWTLEFDGQTTLPLAYSSSRATVMAALESLSNIEGGNIVVAGGPANAAPLTIYWIGAEANKAQPMLVPHSYLRRKTNVQVSIDTLGADGIPTIHQITHPTEAVGGTWRLAWKPTDAILTELTADLPLDATPAEVQAALEDFDTIGPGELQITQPTGGQFVLTWQGPRYGTVAIPMPRAFASLVASIDVPVDANYVKPKVGKPCIQKFTVKNATQGVLLLTTYLSDDLANIKGHLDNTAYQVSIPFGPGDLARAIINRWSIGGYDVDVNVTAKEVLGGAEYTATINSPIIKDYRIVSKNVGDGVYSQYIFHEYGTTSYDMKLAMKGRTNDATDPYAVTIPVMKLIPMSTQTYPAADDYQFWIVQGNDTTVLMNRKSKSVRVVHDGHPDRNHIQSVIISDVEQCTFKLEFDGATSSALNFNATAADVQAALEALSTIGTGNVAVTPYLAYNGWGIGEDMHTVVDPGKWYVEFKEALGVTQQPAIVGSFVASKAKGVEIVCSPNRSPMGEMPTYSIFDLRINLEVNSPVYLSLWWPHQEMQIDGSTTGSQILWELKKLREQGLAPPNSADLDCTVVSPVTEQREKFVLNDWVTTEVHFKVFRFTFRGTNWGNPYDIPAFESMFKPRCGDSAFDYYYSRVQTGQAGVSANGAIEFGYTQFLHYEPSSYAKNYIGTTSSDGLQGMTVFNRIIPTSGTWTLTWARTAANGEPVAGTGDMCVFDWSATAAEVQAALEAIPDIGVGNISITGNPLITPLERAKVLANPYVYQDSPTAREILASVDPRFSVTFIGRLGNKQLRGRAFIAESFMQRGDMVPRIDTSEYQTAGAARNTLQELSYDGYITHADVEIWADGDVSYHSPLVSLVGLMQDPDDMSEATIALRLANAEKNCKALESALGWWYGPGNVDVSYEYSSSHGRRFLFEFKGSYANKSVPAFRAFGLQYGPNPALYSAYVQSYRKGDPDRQRILLPYCFKESGASRKNQIFHLEFRLSDDDYASEAEEVNIGHIQLFGLPKAFIYVQKGWNAAQINAQFAEICNTNVNTISGVPAGPNQVTLGHTGWLQPENGTSYVALKNVKFTDAATDYGDASDRVYAFDVELVQDFAGMPFTFEAVMSASANGGFSYRVAQWARPAGGGDVAVGTWTLTFEGETTMPLPLPVQSLGQVGAAIRSLNAINQNATFCQEAKNPIVFYDAGEREAAYGILDTLGELVPTVYGWAREYIVRFIGDAEYRDNPPFTAHVYAIDSRLEIDVEELQTGKSRQKEVQLLTCQQGNIATDGTWTLSFGGSSATLNWNCTASEAQVVLDAVYGPATLVPSGGPFPTTPLSIEFNGTYEYDAVDEITTASTIVYPIGNATDGEIIGSEIETTEISGLGAALGGLLINLPSNVNKGIWGFEIAGKTVTFPWNAESSGAGELQSQISKVFSSNVITQTFGHHLNVVDIYWRSVSSSDDVFGNNTRLGATTTDLEAAHTFKLTANGSYLAAIRAGAIRFFSDFSRRYTSESANVWVGKTVSNGDLLTVFLRMGEGIYAGTWSATISGKRFTWAYNVTAAKIHYDLQQVFPPVLNSSGTATSWLACSGRRFPQGWLAIEAKGTYKTALEKANSFVLDSDLTADPGVGELSSAHCSVQLVRDGSSGTSFEVTRTESGSGPNFWSSEENWSLGHVPVDGEIAVFANSDVAMLYDYPTDGGLDLAGFRIEPDYAAQFGPDDPSAAPPCFAADSVVIDATSSPYVRLKLAAGTGGDRTVIVQNTSDPEGTDQVVNFSGGDSHTDLIVRKGSVAVAMAAGETHTFRSIVSTHDGDPGADVDLEIGAGGTVPLLYQSGGKVQCWASVTDWKQAAGEAYARGGSVANIESIGGYFFYEIGTSTVAELRFTELAGVLDGVVDFSRNAGAVTVTVAVIPEGADTSTIIIDPMHRLALPGA